LGADWIVKDCSSLSLETNARRGGLVIDITLSGIRALDE
jgi:hypothetical protein